MLVLSRFQNLKYGEIAEILDCEIGAVKVRVYRATRELSQIFYRTFGREGIMNCDEVREQLPDYWTGALDETARSQMHGAPGRRAPTCRAEAETLGAIWKKLGAIPEERPGRALRARFEATLEAYMQGLRQAERGPSTREKLDTWLEGWWPRQPAFQFGFAMAFLAIGLLVGYSLTRNSSGGGEVARLREEVTHTRQLVALSLLQQQSASERLKGVDWSNRMVQPDPKVLSALLHTVNYDQNVNVRLAALDALHQSDLQRHGAARPGGIARPADLAHGADRADRCAGRYPRSAGFQRVEGADAGSRI